MLHRNHLASIPVLVAGHFPCAECSVNGQFVTPSSRHEIGTDCLSIAFECPLREQGQLLDCLHEHNQCEGPWVTARFRGEAWVMMSAATPACSASPGMWRWSAVLRNFAPGVLSSSPGLAWRRWLYRSMA